MFINGSYYYGNGSDTPEKRFHGYEYNGELMTHYGCIFDMEESERLFDEYMKSLEEE